MRPLLIVRLLAAATVVLATGCLALAYAWSDQRREAACWQEAFETGEIPPEGPC